MYDCVMSKLCVLFKVLFCLWSVYLVKSYDYICSTLSFLTNFNDDDGVERCVEDDEFVIEFVSLYFFEEKFIEEFKVFVLYVLVECFLRIMMILWRRRSGEGASIDVFVICDVFVVF